MTWSVAGGRARAQRPVRGVAEAVRAAGDLRDAGARIEAARRIVRAAWGPGAQTAEEGSAAPISPGARGTLRTGLPAGDLDGDGLEDVVVLESAPGRERSSPRMLAAIKGTTGAPLWTLSLSGTAEAFPLPAGDLTGGGEHDVLLLRLFAGEEPETHRWDLSVLEGRTGRAVWRRKFAGESAEVLNADLVPLGEPFHNSRAVTVTNAFVVPLLADDHDKDGLPDLVLNAYDVIDADILEEAGGFPAWAVVSEHQVLVATRSEVVGGDDGRAFLTRAHDYMPGEAGLLPVGDAVGSRTGDLAWWVTTQLFAPYGPYGCVDALVGACAELTGGSILDVEMIDGETGTPAWTVRFAEPQVLWSWILPVADLTGDRDDDLLLWEIVQEPLSGLTGRTSVMSGRDGGRAWSRDTGRVFPQVLGPVGGRRGDDLLLVDFERGEEEGDLLPADEIQEPEADQEGFATLRLTRVDGATGSDLFSTRRRFEGRASVPVIPGFLLPGDLDGDGVLEIVTQVGSRGFGPFGPGAARSRTLVESGRSGRLLLSRSAPRSAFAAGAGDLDADGRDDLLYVEASVRDDVVLLTLTALAMPEGKPLWVRTDRVGSGIRGDYVATADQTGNGGADGIYMRREWEGRRVRSRLDGLDGATGRLVWGRGDRLGRG